MHYLALTEFKSGGVWEIHCVDTDTGEELDVVALRYTDHFWLGRDQKCVFVVDDDIVTSIRDEGIDLSKYDHYFLLLNRDACIGNHSSVMQYKVENGLKRYYLEPLV